MTSTYLAGNRIGVEWSSRTEMRADVFELLILVADTGTLPGKTLSLNARAYSASTPRTLHIQATGHGRELLAHDQHSTFGTTTEPAAELTSRKYREPSSYTKLTK
jgi:hypothetical protein